MPLLHPTRPAKAGAVVSTAGPAEFRCACFAISSESHSAAILLHMQINPAEDWHSLTEHYRAMLDGELEELADSLDDLTETAKEVLRSEMRNRGLGEPGAKPLTRGSEAPAGARWVSSVRPDAQIEDAGKGDAASQRLVGSRRDIRHNHHLPIEEFLEPQVREFLSVTRSLDPAERKIRPAQVRIVNEHHPCL